VADAAPDQARAGGLQQFDRKLEDLGMMLLIYMPSIEWGMQWARLILSMLAGECQIRGSVTTGLVIHSQNTAHPSRHRYASSWLAPREMDYAAGLRLREIIRICKYRVFLLRQL
jgi:hypothetical protein